MNTSFLLRSLGFAMSLGAAACISPSPHSADLVSAGVEVTGVVRGPGGTVLAGAPVWISRVEGGDLVVLGQTYTGADGRFSLFAAGRGLHRIEATAPGCIPSRLDVSLPDRGPLSLDIDLSAARTVVVRGMLLSTEGLPLAVDDLAFLFPGDLGHDELAATTGSDGVPEVFPFTGGSELIGRVRSGPARTAARLPVRRDPTSAAFSLDAPEGSEGDVVLRFREREVATASWAPGARTLELAVDIPSLRASLGDLDLTIGPGAGDGRGVFVARLRDGPGAPLAEIGLLDLPPRVRLVGIPAGDYGVFAGGSAGGALLRARVLAGRPSYVSVSPSPWTGASAVIEAAPGIDLAEALAGFEVRSRDGQRIDASVDVVRRGSSARLDVSMLPDAELVFAAGGTAVTVSPRTSARLALSARRTFSWQVDLDASPPDGAVIDGRLVRALPDGAFVEEIALTLPVQGGHVRVPVSSPPGRFLVFADFGPFGSSRELFDVGEGGDRVARAGAKPAPAANASGADDIDGGA